jgi:hypothetical protein
MLFMAEAHSAITDAAGLAHAYGRKLVIREIPVRVLSQSELGGRKPT